MSEESTSAGHPVEALQALLIGSTDVQVFLADVSKLAVEMVGGDVSCGITTRYHGNLLTVGASDKRAEWLDETQYRGRGGPCLEAFETGEIVESNILEETRWPAYTPTAREYGLIASLSLPMSVAGSTLGALNLYSFTDHEVLRPERRQECERFVAQAAIAVRLAVRQAKDGALLTQLDEALQSRTIIDQALGVIMAGQRCSSTEAFDLLRRQSQNSNRKLREVATDLVTAVSGQPPTPGNQFQVG